MTRVQQSVHHNLSITTGTSISRSPVEHTFSLSPSLSLSSYFFSPETDRPVEQICADFSLTDFALTIHPTSCLSSLIAITGFTGNSFLFLSLSLPLPRCGSPADRQANRRCKEASQAAADHQPVAQASLPLHSAVKTVAFQLCNTLCTQTHTPSLFSRKHTSASDTCFH